MTFDWWPGTWASTNPEFVFLVCLPFAVGAAGILGDLWRQRQPRRPVTEPRQH